MSSCPEQSAPVSIPFPRPGAAPGPQRLPIGGALSEGIRGVLFDTCGVFYDDTVWRRWLLQLLRQVGVHTHYRSFYRIWDRDFLVHVHRGHQTFAQAFHQFMRAIGLSEAQIDEVEAACQARRRTLDASIRPLPGVKSTLTRLKQGGLCLGVLADCELTAAALSERLERIGLGDLISVVISSQDLRQTKPDSACYLAALEALNLSADEVVFVGHDTEELRGATAVGLATVACNFDPDAQADAFLGRFEELLDLLQCRRPYAKAG